MAFQLHVSALGTLCKCGEQFRRRYIEHEKTPPAVRMAIGTAVDVSVNVNLGHKIEAGSLLPDDEVQDAARDAATREWENGVALSPEDADEGLEATKGALIDNSVSLAALHAAKVAPRLDPTHVQRAWVLDIVGLPIQLAGQIDIQEGLESIRDTKTSAKSPVKNTADASLQLTTYALAVRQHDGAIPEKVALDYLVRTPKRGELKVVGLESRRTEDDFGHLIARVEHAARIIETGVFTPAPLDAWWCDPKYCPYHPTCRFARRPVTVQAA